jgi:hypothetical protein
MIRPKISVPHPAAIEDFATWCVRSAVATQQLFDDASAADPSAVRMRISTLEMRSELRLAVTQTQALSIQVAPIDLAYRIAHRFTAEADTTLTLTLEQVPLNTT